MNQLRLLLRQDSMLSLKYCTRTAAETLAIAASSVDAIHDYRHSSSWQPTDRLAAVLFLIGALLSLVCIIVKNDNSLEMRGTAIESYKKGLTMLYELAPNFSAARHSLQRIHSIIVTAKQAIRRFNVPETSALPEVLLDTDNMNSLMNDSHVFEPWMNMEPDHVSQQYGVPALGFIQDFGTSLDDIGSFWTDGEIFQFTGDMEVPKL